MGKHYGHIIINEDKRLQEDGLTRKGIGEKLGYTGEQIKEVLKRHRRNQRKEAAGIVLIRKGRPFKGYVVSEKDNVAELRYKLNRKDYRIKQLEMENELLRDFLQETGRK